MDESAWVRAAAGGEREAFSALVRLHQARLRALVALTLPGRAEVHDVVQEAFIDAWRGLATFDTTREFAPWLRAICRHRLQKYLRDRLPQRRRELALVDVALLESPAETDEAAVDQLAALRACLDQLAVPHRQLLRLRYHDELAVQDIAVQLGRSANAVSMLLLRVKAAVQKCLTDRAALGDA